MLEFLREDDVPRQFRELKRTAAEFLIAVPYWGRGAVETLGIDGRVPSRIICNLASGGCNPHVIGDLKSLRQMKVRTHPRLHAKIYATGNFAIIGSSNASSNGLAEGSPASWIEANILSDDPTVLNRALQLFNEIWTSDECRDVTDSMLAEARRNWKPSRQVPSGPKARTLVAACREWPELFADVYLAPYDVDLGREGGRQLRQLQKLDNYRNAGAISTTTPCRRVRGSSI
jgi:hypothetical protein